MKSVRIGGRDVVAFIEHTEMSSNWINGVTPIPADSGHGMCFSQLNEGCIDVWGVGSRRGKRIAAAYRAGELPVNDERKMNQILRPDEDIPEPPTCDNCGSEMEWDRGLTPYQEELCFDCAVNEVRKVRR
jgi:hypothetical protein